MPHPTDESDSNLLPDPELNPLLNPLLAAHMGRWAEVYFTNPPEKRGQAVSELLRELENISTPEPPSVPVVIEESNERKTDPPETPNWFPAAAEPALTCGACAYNNSAGQRFCGMCGASLQVSPQTQEPQAAESVPIASASWSEPGFSQGGNSAEYAIEPDVRAVDAGGPHDRTERAWPPQEKYLQDIGLDSQPVPYRHRLYVGMALAILLVVLVYMAWRGTVAFSDAGVPQSAPSQKIPPAQPALAAPAPRRNATASPAPEAKPPDSLVQSPRQPDVSRQKNQSGANDARPEPRIVSVAADSTNIAADQSGAEELTTAEKYLNGNAGVARDSGEAAQWLWKAVRKQNLAATVALSDLYLRGDGVPKSCDQARLLLDAAARKGGKAAAERLQNLQAFGCE